MKVGFIFTNFNNSSFTKDAVASLNSPKNSQHDYYITIVDNNSNQENVDILVSIKKEWENVELILSKENPGYFKGLNVGILHIRKLFPNLDCIIIGNNDLIFPNNFHTLLDENKSVISSYAVVSPNIVTMNGEYQNPHVISSISPFREFIYDLYYSNYLIAILIKKTAALTKLFTDRKDESQHDVAQVIYQGHGSCFILGPNFLKNFEQLWAPTFLMYEEVFLSLQLREKGLNIYYEPKIKITHQYHASIGKISSKKIWEYSKLAHKEYRKYVGIMGLKTREL